MKKGEITSSQIAFIVLAILGAMIIALIFWQFFSSDVIDTESCHASVIARGTLPDVGIPLSESNIKDLASLKCKTQKICFGESCEDDFGNSDYSKISVGDLEDVQRTISRSYLECWDMMGQGKISVGSYGAAQSFGVGKLYSTCVVCSRFAFDKEINWNFDELDIQNYMLTHAPPGKEISYIEYITGESPIDLAFNEDDFINKLSEKKELKVNQDSEIPFLDLNSDELAIVYVEIVSPDHQEVLLNDLKLALGIGAVGFRTAGAINTLSVLRSPYTLVAVALGLVYQQVNTYSNRMVSAGVCGDVKFGGKEKEGCSVVRVLPYDVEYLGQFCGKFENIS